MPLALHLLLALQSTPAPITGFEPTLGLTRLGDELVGLAPAFFGNYSLFAFSDANGLLPTSLTPITLPLPSTTRWAGGYVFGTTAADLQVSDGTAAGTFPFLPPDLQTQESGIESLSPFGSRLAWAFRRSAGPIDWVVQVSDGPGATPMTLTLGEQSSPARSFTELGELLLFASGSAEMFATDGTQAGTVPLAPGQIVTNFAGEELFVSDGEHVWFPALDEVTDEYSVWRSDGTAGGTEPVFAMPPGGIPGQLRRFAGSLAFRNLGSAEKEVRVMDVQTLAVDQLTVAEPGTRLLPVRMLEGLPEFLWLRTPPDVGGPALRRSDGTDAGTVSVDPGVELTDVTSVLVQVGTDGSFVFRGDGPAGEEPWFTDGTEAGTRLIGDLQPGSLGSRPSPFVPFGDRVAFLAQIDGQLEVWSQGLGELGVTSLHGLGEACSGAPVLRGSGLPELGATVQLELSGGLPGQFGALLLSGQLAPAPAVGGCAIGLLDPSLVQLIGLDAAGGLVVDLAVPADPALQGRAARLQAAFFQAAGPLGSQFTATRLLEALIGG